MKCDGTLCINPFNYCGENNKGGILGCSLAKGHTGDHIACSTTKHNVETWSNDIEPKSKMKTPKKMYEVFVWQLDHSIGSGKNYIKLIPSSGEKGAKLDEEQVEAMLANPQYKVDESGHKILGTVPKFLVFCKKLGKASGYEPNYGNKQNCTQAYFQWKAEKDKQKTAKFYSSPPKPKTTSKKSLHFSTSEIGNWTPEPAIVDNDPNKTWATCTLKCGSIAQSQKIKGLSKRTTYVEAMTSANEISQARVLIQGDGACLHQTRASDSAAFSAMQGKFVRPCPSKPRHGFVDSRVISSEQEARTIVEEVIKAGERPEFIIMPKIDCSYSGVITTDLIAFGRSNDGATQGNDTVNVKLNIGPTEKDHIRNSIWHSKEWPYAETLYNGNDKPILVQLRAGPNNDESKVVKVVEVYKVDPKMELLEWAVIADALRKKTKVVHGQEWTEESVAVWHPGGSIASHFGVWCSDPSVQAPTIPYVMDEIEPKIGSIIEIGKKNKPKLSAFKEGLVLGLSAELKERASVVKDLRNFLGSFHLYALADLGDEFTAKYIGYSWAIGARVIAALPFGECTHSSCRVGGPTTTHSVLGAKLTGERDYEKVWRVEIERVLLGLHLCHSEFTNYKWKGSYGGPKWASCTSSIIKVIANIRAFVDITSSQNLSELVTATNIMVNEVHNGGWWLNKLLSKDVFDNASILPHFTIRPERAFEVKELGKLDRFKVKMEGRKVVKRLEVKLEDTATFVDKAQELEIKAQQEYIAEEAKKAKDLAKWKLENKPELYTGETPKVLVKAQYVINSGSTIHIQIPSTTIDKGYHTSNPEIDDVELFHKVELDFHKAKVNNKLVGSLAGTGKGYASVLLGRLDSPWIYIALGILSIKISNIELYNAIKQIEGNQKDILVKDKLPKVDQEVIDVINKLKSITSIGEEVSYVGIITDPEEIEQAVTAILTSSPNSKIKAIKAYRSMTGATLIEAKQYVEALEVKIKSKSKGKSRKFVHKKGFGGDTEYVELTPEGITYSVNAQGLKHKITFTPSDCFGYVAKGIWKEIE